MTPDQIAVNAFRNGMNLVTEIRDAPERKRREDEMYDLQRQGAELNVQRLRGGLADAESRREHEAQMRPLALEQAQFSLSAAQENQGREAERFEMDKQRHSQTMESERAASARAQWAYEQQQRLAQKADEIAEIESIMPFLADGYEMTSADAKRVQDAFAAVGMSYQDMIQPEYFEHMANIEDAARTGQFTPETFQSLTHVLGPSIRKGIGTPGAHGGTIVDKRIVNAAWDPERQGFAWDLEVVTQDENGRQSAYVDRITRNRSTDPNDPVVFTPMRDLMTQLQGREYLARGLQRKQARARANSAIVRRGGVPRTGQQPQQDSAKVQYLQYVANQAFGGDVQKAFEAINARGDSLLELAVELAKSEISADKFGQMNENVRENLVQNKLEMLRSLKTEDQSGSTVSPGRSIPQRSTLAPEELDDTLNASPAGTR